MSQTADPENGAFRTNPSRPLCFTFAIKRLAPTSPAYKDRLAKPDLQNQTCKNRLAKTGSRNRVHKKGRLEGGLFPFALRTYLSNQNQSAWARRQSALRCSLRPMR